MGMNSSGAISDKVYYELAERKWLMSMNMRRSFGCLFYQRYRDDTIFVLEPVLHGEENLNEKIIQGVRSRLHGEYKIKIEEVDKYAMRILDFKALKSRGTLQFAPHLKQIFPKYLTPTSGHARFIHQSWPLSRVKRLGELASGPQYFFPEKEMLLNRYRSNGVHPAALELAAQHNPYEVCPSVTGLPCKELVEDEKCSTMPETWCPLTHHPLLERARLQESVRASLLKWSCGHDESFCIPRIAWRNGGMPLVQILRKI